MERHLYFHSEDVPTQALYCRRGPPHKTPAFNVGSTEVYTHTRHSCVQNVLLMLHSFVYGWTVQLALGTALMVGYLCYNVGLVFVCLPSGSTDVAPSPS